MSLAGLALAVGLGGCGGGDAPPSSGSSSTASESSASAAPSAGGTETPSMFRQVLEVKRALTQAEVATPYAHARVSVEVAGGKPGSGGTEV